LQLCLYLAAHKRRYRSITRLATEDLKPGRGVPRLGIKALHRLRVVYSRFEDIMADCNRFQSVAHISVEDFRELLHLVKKEVNSPLDPMNCLSPQEHAAMRPRKKLLKADELLLLFLDVMGGGVCGAQTLQSIATKYGGCRATAWNYVYHSSRAIFVHFQLNVR